MDNNFEQIQINAARVCDGLRKIGYTPPSAIMDIIDNSVQAKATEIYVTTVPKIASEARRENVKEYVIIDNGIGMSSQQIKEALRLGSSPDDYEAHSLSKFGLGLKSASFSQGERLEVISSDGTGDFCKYVVSLPLIRERDQYGAFRDDLLDEDVRLIEDYLSESRGTIIRIAEVREANHPTIQSTYSELRTKIGVTYYYMLSEGLNIYLIDIQDNIEQCMPYDVLFVDEANEGGDLDEADWDGTVTQWIERPRTITLDPSRNIKAQVEVTQLPYPPIFALGEEDQQKEIRDKYMIGAGNYGFYVYRNQRLLSWADSLGVVSADQDLYSFRGRVLIDESADEVLNIDVKKTDFHLSEVAQNAVKDASHEYLRKSRRAWQTASDERKRRDNENAYHRSNELANEINVPDELPGTVESEEDLERLNQREREIQEIQIQKAQDLAKRTTGSPQPTKEEVDEAVKGEDAHADDRILLVDNIEDNALWEPLYYGGEYCVRINRFHRFASLVYVDNRNNGPLTVVLNLFLLQLAKADFYLQRIAESDQARQQIEILLAAFRRTVSDYLAILCREGSEQLPRD